MEKVQSLSSTLMPNNVNMFHISAHSASRQAPEYSASLTDVIPFLDSAKLLPLWKQMLTPEMFLHQFSQSETTTWCICIVL